MTINGHEPDHVDRKRRAIEVALRRRIGMSEEKRKQVEAHNLRQTDWRGRCPRCGEEVSGTITQCKAHRCGSA